jgi:organic radical activating enzyme
MIRISTSLQNEFKALARSVSITKESLVIYGGGQVGRQMYTILTAMGYKVKAVLDKNPGWAGCYYDTPVINPDDYNNFNDTIVICLHTEFDSGYTLLKNRGFKQILPYFFYLLDDDNTYIDEDYYDYYQRKWALSPPPHGIFFSIDIPVTMKCSLKCRDCANLMQYFKHPQNVSFNKTISALERLLSTLDKCQEIRILGGEPFCNPDVYKYIEALDNFKDKFDWIIILTNGTILPNKQTLESFKGRKLFVRISDYNTPKNKIDDLTNLLNKNGILYSVTKWDKWQNCGTLKNYGRTVKENMKILLECCVSNTPAIVDGKLFRCPYSGNMYELFGGKVIRHEFVDLLAAYTHDALLENINSFMSSKNLNACNYCGGRPLDGYAIPAARQAGEALDYYIE